VKVCIICKQGVWLRVETMSYEYTNLVGKSGGHCATSRKVDGSIPDGVIGIFH
jgi:hypothetical protein